jgi:hypothetical protein
MTFLLALTGCIDPLPRMRQLDDLGLFEDQADDVCAPDVVSAWGGPFEGAWVQAVAAAGDRLYVFRETTDEAWLTTLDVTDPRQVRSLGSGHLPGVEWVGRAGVHQGTLLASWRKGGEQLATIDVEDPWSPEVLDALELGRDGAPTTFASSGDLVFTDGGAVHAVDLSDPRALAGVAFEDLPPLGAPLVVGDALLANEDGGRLGEGCAAVVYDPAVSPPAERSRLETPVCASAGRVEVDGGVLGLGWRDAQPFAEALATEPWAVTGDLPLADADLRHLDLGLAVGGGALVVGRGESGTWGRAALVRLRDGVPVHAASWWPELMFLGSAAVANDLVWVVASRESGDFEGVVALSFAGCP